MKLEEIIRSNSDLKSSKKIDLLGVSSISCSGSFDVEFIQSDLDTGFALALSDNDDILNNIWGENYFGTDRVVDDLIRRLRKKMPLLDINTIYGYGYRLL